VACRTVTQNPGAQDSDKFRTKKTPNKTEKQSGIVERATLYDTTERTGAKRNRHWPDE
jgi:hypothetical protein